MVVLLQQALRLLVALQGVRGSVRFVPEGRQGALQSWRVSGQALVLRFLRKVVLPSFRDSEPHLADKTSFPPAS